MSEPVERKALARATFKHDKYFLLLLLTFCLSLSAVILLSAIFGLRNLSSPLPVYFPATVEGELIAEAPLTEASIEPNELLNWTNQAMMAAHTFNFVNYPTILEASRIYFTPEGYEGYKNALTNRRIIERVSQNKLVLKATPTDAPQILLEKPLAGRYMWKIKAPMRFRYQNVTNDLSEQMEITLVVMRVPTTQSPNGVLILKYDLALSGQATSPY